MNKFALILILFSCNSLVHGQNMVINPSFEDYAVDNVGNLFAKDWIVPNLSSIDYYSKKSSSKYRSVPNNQFGYHPAYDGNAYIGMVLLDWSGEMEHYTGYLRQPLKKDSTYKICFHIRYGGDSVWIYSKTIELLFTKESKLLYWDTNYRHLFDYGKHITASVKIDIEKTYTSREWVECTAEYKAHGGEKFFTFGLFYQGDVFFKLCTEYLNKYNNFEKQVKFIKTHEAYPIFTNKNFKPTLKNRYFVYAYYYIDAVSIIPKKEEVDDFTF